MVTEWSDTQVDDEVWFKSWVLLPEPHWFYEPAKVRVLIENSPKGWRRAHLTIIDEDGNPVRNENNLTHFEDWDSIVDIGIQSHWRHIPSKRYYL